MEVVRSERDFCPRFLSKFLSVESQGGGAAGDALGNESIHLK